MPTSRRRPPLPLRTIKRPAAVIEIGFGEAKRFLDAQPSAP